jgi:Flp pilus assembly protein TadB
MAFKLSAAPALLGAVAWSIGAWSLGSVLVALGSCVFAALLLVGLIAERRERRRSS